MQVGLVVVVVLYKRRFLVLLVVLLLVSVLFINHFVFAASKFLYLNSWVLKTRSSCFTGSSSLTVEFAFPNHSDVIEG